MAVQVFADDNLVYDSRMVQDPKHNSYSLLGLKTTTGLNKGGTLELIMPPGHPAYNFFTSYKTVVTLRENGALRFRGRALYPTDDFYNCRTITCEGERGFLRDLVSDPHLYEDSPAAIFESLVQEYNTLADEYKRFTLGQVTVTDPNNYIRLENENAETYADLFDRLVERCGGYITFTDDGNGGRAINWLAEVGQVSNQPIEFGQNLLDFSLSGQSDELATAIKPYGAQLEDGTRVDIRSVNNGQNWIADENARSHRGLIMATVTWDDVTEPANLLAKAWQWLDEHKRAVTALQLSSVDLSRFGRNLDTYADGDLVPVHSKPHSLDENFQLTDRSIDWLDPSGGTITLGKSRTSLTGADAMMERDVNNKIVILNNAVINGKVETQKLERTLTSRIDQLAGSITLEVSGGLGNTAAIRLNVDGDSYTQSMDLSEVRKAFQDDPSSITLEAGTITFNSNTLVINSSHFTLDDTGYITATGGTIGGWTLKSYKLYAGDGVNTKTVCVQAPTENNLYVFAAGGTSHDSYADCPFRVTKHGQLYATDAEISGTVTTVSTKYKAELSSGGLKLYHEDVLCGNIDTRYHAAQQENGRGIALRLEQDGKYLMFCSTYTLSSGSTATLVHYYLNIGFSSNYEEYHIFQTSARFLDKVYFDNYVYTHGYYQYEGYFVKSCDTDGNVGEEMMGFRDGTLYLGSNYANTIIRGAAVYLKNTSTTVTSDRNAKNSIEELPEAYEAFVDALVPVRYKYNGGTSGRYHVGFIAQDVEAALTAAGLTTQDFAGYVDINHTGELGLQYSEFVAVLLQKIKRLEQRVNALQAAQ